MNNFNPFSDNRIKINDAANFNVAELTIHAGETLKIVISFNATYESLVMLCDNAKTNQDINMNNTPIDAQVYALLTNDNPPGDKGFVGGYYQITNTSGADTIYKLVFKNKSAAPGSYKLETFPWLMEPISVSQVATAAHPYIIGAREDGVNQYTNTRATIIFA